MQQSLYILYNLLETNSGTVYLAEEKNQYISKKYYAFQFSQQKVMNEQLKDQIKTLEKSKRPDLFRNYIKMHKDGPQQLSLFHYNEGNQFLDQKIKDYGKIKKSFDYVEIKSYLKNLLAALYELHSNQIPGRVFSTFNIVVQPGEKLVLMDFGFEPDIEQNHLDILAPPEYLEKLINKENSNKTDFTFDLKFDSWLVGAFLYHLIKFQSINQVRDVRYKYDKKQEFYDYLKVINFIPCQTSRYKTTLLSLVEGLLTCDPKKRLSFYQIYQHPLISELKLEGYIDFYEKCEQIEDLKNKIIDTGLLPREHSNFDPPLINPFISSQSSHQEVLSAPNQTNQPDYLVVVMNTPQFSDPSFYNYWLKIQLDCLRCYLLAQTTDKITILSKYDYTYVYVLVYIIKKMHLLILTEINNYLKAKLYQNQPNRNWEIFLNQHQKDLIANEQMKQYLIELHQELKTISQQHCQIHLKQDSQLPKEIQQSLKDDKVQDPYDYFLNGYADAIKMLLEYTNQLITQNQQQKLEELKAFKNLIYFCVDINFSFQPQTFKEQFKQLTQNNQEVQPKDVIDFLGLTNNFR